MTVLDRLVRMATGRCRMCDARHHDLVDAQRELVATAADLGETRQTLLAARKENDWLRAERVDAEHRAVKAASAAELAELAVDNEARRHQSCHNVWRARAAHLDHVVAHLTGELAAARELLGVADGP